MRAFFSCCRRGCVAHRFHDDPRERLLLSPGRAIEQHLMRDGLLLRYDTKTIEDSLSTGERAFLTCNFWLIDVYLLQGRYEEAMTFFGRLLSICNDVGLLSEGYDAKRGLVGNFPQSFSHVGLINAAMSLRSAPRYACAS
ncbi:MAG TPA: glycoside hydrolase family 15 protein [Candidatus Aquilonibacter sp.]|nr:glycoside hydrolase family 15 protein [Candidatus Aquilonibacter sp.]